MSEQQRTDKITGGNIFLRLIQGAVFGIASMIPFFQVKVLKETMGFRRDTFGNETTYWNKVLYALMHYWSYFIGFFSGFVIFFFIPVESEIDKFPMAYVGGLLALCLGFGIFEVYQFFHCEKTLKRNIVSFLLFIGCFGISFLLFALVPVQSVDTWLSSVGDYFLLLGLMTIGSFLYNFSGISIGTLLFVSSSFVSIASTFNSHLYNQTRNGVLLFFVSIYGIILGYGLNILLTHFLNKHLDQHRHAVNAGFYLAGILLVCIFMIKEPYFGYEDGSTVTMTAQIVTLVSTIIGCLGVSFGLTFHGYKFLNKEDYLELNEFKD